MCFWNAFFALRFNRICCWGNLKGWYSLQDQDVKVRIALKWICMWFVLLHCQCLDPIASTRKIIGSLWIAELLKRSCRGQIEVLPGIFPERLSKTKNKLRITGAPAQIRNVYLPNTIIRNYCSTNRFSKFDLKWTEYEDVIGFIWLAMWSSFGLFWKR
jgi:hypothetical protein